MSAPVNVWWAAPRDVRPAHRELLDEVEQTRHDRYVHRVDRDRFTLGVALTRLALARRMDVDPAKVPLLRDCPDCGRPHGRPRLAPASSAAVGPFISVSHSGDRVAVALALDGPVGVDVEAAARPLDDDVVGQLLAAPELVVWRTLPADRRQAALLAYWTRKEAILKATGDGLREPMDDLHVTPPQRPPELLDWPRRPELVGRVRLHPLNPGAGHAACLALLDQPDAAVRERPGTELLHG